LYSTYISFLVINVCNRGKNLCSPCTYIYIPSSASVFKNRDFPYKVVAWSPIIMPMFPPFMTRFDHSGRDHVVATQFPPLSCYFADLSQPSQAAAFIKCGWLLLCFMAWSCTSVGPCGISYASQNCLFVFTNDLTSSVCLSRNFVFLLFFMHKFFEPNRRFAFKN